MPHWAQSGWTSEEIERQRLTCYYKGNTCSEAKEDDEEHTEIYSDALLHEPREGLSQHLGGGRCRSVNAYTQYMCTYFVLHCDSLIWRKVKESRNRLPFCLFLVTFSLSF
jgi:hypothetical protein